jgi:hypothetical protein
VIAALRNHRDAVLTRGRSRRAGLHVMGGAI